MPTGVLRNVSAFPRRAAARRRASSAGRPPVLEALPLGIVPHCFRGLEEGVCVDQAAASNADAVQNEGLAKQPQTEDPPATDLGEPEGLADVPVGLWKVLGPPTFAFFEHRDAVALFGHPMGGDRSAETRADHRDVSVEIVPGTFELLTHSASSVECTPSCRTAANRG